jgi:hypothetical protein
VCRFSRNTGQETKENLMSSAGLQASEEDLDEVGLDEEGLDSMSGGVEQLVEDD